VTVAFFFKKKKYFICKLWDTKEGTTNVTFDRDGMTLFVKDVPARICTNCGKDYVNEQVAYEILTIAEHNRKERGTRRCTKSEFPDPLCHVNRTCFSLKRCFIFPHSATPNPSERRSSLQKGLKMPVFNPIKPVIHNSVPVYR